MPEYNIADCPFYTKTFELIHSMNPNRRVFLQHLGLGLLGLSTADALPADRFSAPTRTLALPRSLPEAQGVASAGLLDFVNAIDANKLNVHSMMVVRHGKVVAEGWWGPYAPELKHTLYSLSKSFTSSAVGLAVADGKLTVDDKVVSFFPQDLPATVSANLAAMRIKDLLTMNTGHDKDTTGALRGGTDTNWIKSFLAQPVDHQPGTYFVYNSGATYMLSAIVQKLTGKTVLAYLTPRLFAPLGITGADWEVDPNGINTGGWGLRLHTEDIAKFGQLYLQKGNWNGKQLLPAAWIADATRAEVNSWNGDRSAKADESDWLQGYGYQFWRCRHGAYRGDGAFGQYCLVLPKEDTVIAMTSESADLQGILNQVWTHVLPALQAGKLTAGSTDAALKQKLASLALPIPAVQSTSPVATSIDGKLFTMADNTMQVKSVSLNFGKDGFIFTMQDDRGSHRINGATGRWVEGETDLSTLPLKLAPTPVPGETKTKVATSGTWTDPNTFMMTVRFIETAHYETITCSFDNNNLQVAFKKSLAILNPSVKDDRPTLQGRLVA